MKRYGRILGKSWLSAIGSFFTFLFFFFVMTSCRKRGWVARSILLMMSSDSLWIGAGWLLFVCLFSFLCFFLVTIFPCYDEQWLVVNGGRVAGLGARSKPRGECHRFMAEQLPAPPAPPHYPKLSSIPASTFNSLLSLLQIHFGNQLLAIDDFSTWIPKREAAQLSEDLTLTIYPNTLMRLTLEYSRGWTIWGARSLG